MEIKERIQQAINVFIQSRLAEAVVEKRSLLEYMLGRTRMQVESLMAKNASENISVAEIEDLCDAFDHNPTTFNQDVLESLGFSGLGKDILNYGQKVKWEIYVNHLKTVLSDDVLIFYPAMIKQLDSDLYSSIKAGLLREVSHDDDFDWELFRAKLPPDLADRFEVKRLSNEETRRVLDENTKNKIEELELSDVLSVLGGDPKKLAFFLDIAGLSIDEKEKNRIVYVSFSGLRQRNKDSKLIRLMEDSIEVIDPVEVLSDVPEKTNEGHIRMKVKVPDGTKNILVRGCWNRDIKVNGDKEITFDVVLRPGEDNEILIMAYNEEEQMRGPLQNFNVFQTGEGIDEDALIEFLKALSEKTFEEIASDEGKQKLFRKFIEEASIKRFSGVFEDGEVYMNSLIETQGNEFVKSVLRDVLELFRQINLKEFSFISENEQLMFFQKYCVYKIQRVREVGKVAILANEPGLGKTVTALAATHDDELLVACPNSAASTWIEQVAKFFPKPFLANLAGHDYEKRIATIGETELRGVLTNVEFLRLNNEVSGEEKNKYDRKFEILNQKRNGGSRVTVVDEAHFLKNNSQQTEGFSRLEDDFTLLLTASPFRTPSALFNVMSRVLPDDPRFENVSAFKKAFPANDPSALKALYLMVQPYVVRFLKSEVMPTYDLDQDLDKQPISLPKKKYIDPFETGIGRFTLTESQQMAIYDLFENWQAWTEKYERYMPKGKMAREDGLRASDNRLTKLHALRQIVNSPAFIGVDEESPKHQAAREILEKELGEGNKVVVFCRYHVQVHAYMKMLDEMGYKYSMFTGEVTKKGYIKNGNKKKKFFVDEFDNFVLGDDGRPVEAKPGQDSKEMLAIDYERLVFQNDPEVMVCLSTYSAGSQSVTFTAANVMIKDDLPDDYILDYQTEDRIHRIDAQRRKAEVRYYNLISNYDEMFLELMKEMMVERELPDGSIQEFSAYDLWFAVGTYDEVHFSNLAAQKVGFELLNNGISVDPDMVEEEQSYNLK